MKRIVRVMSGAACLAVLSGCSIINGILDPQLAMGSGPAAVEATERLTDDAILRNVALSSKNEKARVAAAEKIQDDSAVGTLAVYSSDEKIQELAIKKLKNEYALFHQLMCDGSKPKAIRLLAFNRLLELGTLERILQGDGGDRDKLVKELLLGEKGLYPVEWRLKAIARARLYDGEMKPVVLDESEPESLRIAVAQAMDRPPYEELAERASGKGVAGAAGKRILKAAAAKAKDVEYGSGELADIAGERRYSKDVRLLAYSLIRSEEDRMSAIQKAIWRAGDAENATAADDAVACEILASVSGDAVLEEIIARPGCRREEVAKYLKIAAGKIASDEVRKGLLQKDLPGEVALAVAAGLKDEASKGLLVLEIEAKDSPDAQTRGKALVKICATDAKKAYDIVWGWVHKDKCDASTDRHLMIPTGKVFNKAGESLDTINSPKSLASILMVAEKDKREFARTVERAVKRRVLAILQARVDKLDQEKLAGMKESGQQQAAKAAEESNACVIGGYYVGLPLTTLLVLNKTEGNHVTPAKWHFEDPENAVVTEFSVDAATLFKLTGIEKSRLHYALPEKYGLDAFRSGMTKIEYDRNEIAEYFGDYSSSFKGGDIYHKSETQAKNLKVVNWEQSGLTVFSRLND